MHVRSLIASDPGWLARLENEYAIHVVRDGDLVSLKYNQIERAYMRTQTTQALERMLENAGAL